MPSTSQAFLLASRPKTWSASLAPVLIGGAIAVKETALNLPIFTLTLLFSLLIQIGTNYANDYFDFIKGADTKERIGPKRAVQQGWIAPKLMLNATFITFGIAFLIALPLMLKVGWWSFVIAACCILSGILYTGGPKPFGYLGLGEIFVFLFFGPVATIGTFFLQTQTANLPIFIASLAPGFLSSAILMANNLRDATTDKICGKRTLVVRFGTRFGRIFYILCIQGAALIALFFSLTESPLLFALFLILLVISFRKPSLKSPSILLSIYALSFALLW
ncbi:MAG: 1,4-dihydroxy-2-naphthoate polyprenyltransferase [Chlamydiae bacterium]|nr:1,4-dihydroxy-2-naphthoate polyprenyltransferase [Chlamydiota bacterium]